MSQTVTNRPSQLTIQTVKDQTTLETLNRASSTDDSSATKSRLGVSDTENQSSLSTEGPEEWTNGDIKELESVERQLNRETVHKHDYHRELERIQESMKSTMASKLPSSLKVTMMESLMEKLRTNMNCVREANRVMKENMVRDSNQQRSASSSPSRRLGMDKQSVKVEEIRESPVKGEGEETVEEVKKEIKKLEETIAQMKQTRNSLTIALEDKADSIEDIQALLKEKKQALDRKTIMVENMKLKISSTSDKKTSGRSGGATHRKTNSEMGLFSLKNYLKKSTSKNDNDKTVDMSTSRLETSVLKEMSSKIGNVFGKMGRVFGKKDGKVSDQILNTEFLRELENQSTPASLNNSLVECGRRDMNLSISNFNFK